MKLKKKIIAWFMIFAMVLGAFSPAGAMGKVEAAEANINVTIDYYIDENGNDVTGDGSSTKPYKTVKKAFDVINSDEDVTSDTGIRIRVKGTIKATAEARLEKKCNVILQADEGKATIIRDAYFGGSIINVDADVQDDNLIMKDIILDGGIQWTGDNLAPLGRGTSAGSGGVQPAPERTYQAEYMSAAFKVSKGNVTLQNCEIRNNYNDHPSYAQVRNPKYDSTKPKNDTDNKEYITPYDSGGGIHVAGGSILFLKGCKVHNNYARHQGGGIWKDGYLNIDENSDIYGNRAADWGGGIYQLGGLSVISHTVIRNNSAGGSGGGIDVCVGELTINNSEIYGNYIDIVWGVNERALGGAGIRVESVDQANLDANGNKKIQLGANLKVYGNSCRILKDGSGAYSEEKSASGIMIDKSPEGVDIASSVKVYDNYVSNTDVKPNEQYFITDADGKSYYKPSVNLPQYNIGWLGAKEDVEPTVTITPDVTLYHKGAAGTLTVTVTDPEGVAAGTATIAYQWYEADKDGNKTKKYQALLKKPLRFQVIPSEKSIIPVRWIIRQIPTSFRQRFLHLPQ